ncbi:helix-turn-helix domain-containing protein [Enterococcus faecium]|nr:helix-turn-helix domain-containing protein [Enterococcus faecium]MCS8592012.1 DNA-binding protein [Enterococcus faecium]
MAVVCQYLHISNNTMDRWIKQGLPRTMIQGVIRFDKVCLDHWMMKHLIQ